jgi:hypothetical protein
VGIAELLQEHISENTATFDWSNNNCCHFAARWVERVSGFDPMQELPSTPTARDALRLIKSLGGDLESAWSTCMGLDSFPPAFACDGDLMLVDVDEISEGGGAVIGICSGRHAVALGVDGKAVFLPRTRAQCAWKVTPCLS